MLNQDIKIDTVCANMEYAWCNGFGMPLVEIHAWLKETYGCSNGSWIFSEWCTRNQNNKEFMQEFQSSCFIENINQNQTS